MPDPHPAPDCAPPDCSLCPRLARFRADNRTSLPEHFNAPVPAFGADRALLLIVGLAPGLHGANRTGRPFTGDHAGDLLYPTLIEFGFATGTYGREADDGLVLWGARITNAVRCVPPQNKPLPAEIRSCNSFLGAEIAKVQPVAILALGRIAHEAVLRALSVKLATSRFAHGARHDLPGAALFDSYHCSRYNTNTGRLTPEMFLAVFADIRSFIEEKAGA